MKIFSKKPLNTVVDPVRSNNGKDFINLVSKEDVEIAVKRLLNEHIKSIYGSGTFEANCVLGDVKTSNDAPKKDKSLFTDAARVDTVKISSEFTRSETFQIVHQSNNYDGVLNSCAPRYGSLSRALSNFEKSFCLNPAEITCDNMYYNSGVFELYLFKVMEERYKDYPEVVNFSRTERIRILEKYTCKLLAIEERLPEVSSNLANMKEEAKRCNEPDNMLEK